MHGLSLPVLLLASLARLPWASSHPLDTTLTTATDQDYGYWDVFYARGNAASGYRWVNLSANYSGTPETTVSCKQLYDPNVNETTSGCDDASFSYEVDEGWPDSWVTLWQTVQLGASGATVAITEIIYAQIIDGLPISDVAYDSRKRPFDGHPIHDAHEDLCPDMLEKAQEFRDAFEPEILTFNSQLVHEYRACAPGSRGFETRLIEMAAVAVHQISVALFKLDTSVHKDDGITEWEAPKSDTWFWERYPNGPLPTLFRHTWYVDYNQYPESVADMVGYWAEARVLGGVVLFDRRKPDTEPSADPDAVYFHSDRQNVTYRIYQLLPEQRKALLDFLTADGPQPMSPLPILGNQDNRIRVDPEEPIRTTGIYRDLWERKDLSPDAGNARLMDMINEFEYPTMEGWTGTPHDFGGSSGNGELPGEIWTLRKTVTSQCSLEGAIYCFGIVCI